MRSMFGVLRNGCPVHERQSHRWSSVRMKMMFGRDGFDSAGAAGDAGGASAAREYPAQPTQIRTMPRSDRSFIDLPAGVFIRKGRVRRTNRIAHVRAIAA